MFRTGLVKIGIMKSSSLGHINTVYYQF